MESPRDYGRASAAAWWSSRPTVLWKYCTPNPRNLVLGQSVYRSWVYNFQGQGRDLFPILPMLFFYWRVAEAPSLRVGTLLVAALLGMHSIVSFALVGLAAVI